MKTRYDLPCNIAQSLNIIGDRWTLLVIHEIHIGNVTFSGIKKALEGISSNLLSERLKSLEEDNLIATTLYSTHPPRYKYTLTEKGKDLEPVFHSLVVWGEKHLEKCYKKAVHKECRHEVQIAYYCPDCDKNVTDIDIIPVEESTVKK